MKEVIISFCMGYGFGYTGMRACLNKDLGLLVVAGALLIAAILRMV